MVAFYNAKDRAIYDAGDKFVPQTEYLQNNYVPTKGISYEGDGSPVSYANSGIMSGYMTPPPIIYPPINQGGGNGPPGPGPTDYGYTGPGSTGSKKGFDIEDIGEGTIDDEDDDEGSLGIIDGLRAMGAFTFGGLLNTGLSINKSINRNKQKEIDDINADINAQYGYGTGAATQETMDSYEGSDGSYAGASTQDYGGGEKDGGFIDGSNRRKFFYGGLVSIL